MGLFSSVKKLFKKLVQGIKLVARLVVRVIITVWTPFIKPWDFAFGFLGWPHKKLRIKVLVLSDASGNPVLNPVTAAAAFDAMIDDAKKVFKDRLGVTLVPYGKTFVEVITEPAPHYALDVHCAKDFGAFTIDEAGDAGEYLASHLAGWNAIPISLAFPVTVFVVESISDRNGCSLGPLTDYVTLDVNGVKESSTMAHELGHACNLWHSGSQANLMWAGSNRGDQLHWWQKNLFRNSRHVTYV